MIRALENAELWWEPGTKIGYHAYTFGYLAGEIVRRSTGRRLAEVYAALLAEVNGLRLISPEALEQAATLAVEGTDEVFGNKVRWTLAFGMGGVGGSWAGADTATGTSLAVTKNLLTENFDTAARIARMVFA